VSYGEDLAYIHDAGFTGFVEHAAPHILEILWKHGIRDGLVVDAGCGSGVLSRELRRAGFAVFAFDASPAMVALAGDAHVGSYETIALPPCRAVVAVGEIFNYGGSPASFFARCAAELLSFDVALYDETAHLGERRIDGEDWVVFTRKFLEGRTLVRRVTTYRWVNGESRKSEEEHRLQLYDRDEIAAMLREAGYRVSVRRSYGGPRLPPAHGVFVAVR
jgi:hypothetical protein